MVLTSNIKAFGARFFPCRHKAKGGSTLLNLPEGLLVKQEFLGKVVENIAWNKVLDYYYGQLQNEQQVSVVRGLRPTPIGKARARLRECNKYWQLEVYHQSLIKDFKKTSLCRDKFCNNCKKVKQAERMAKFIPSLQVHSSQLYHLVVTVPNVTGQELKLSIKRMFKAFRGLIRYLKGERKAEGIDLTSLGFTGAVRSLEITFKGNMYHPHIHCGLVLAHPPGKKKIKNAYSLDHSGKRGDRAFSSEEILIQKIWRLLYDGQRVTKENIDQLEIGYSCTLDQFTEDNYTQLFKYITKGTDQSGNTISYSQFKTLYYALKGIRQIQGYGVLYDVEEEGLDYEEVDGFYDMLIESLKEKEAPEVLWQTPQELLKEKRYKVISRKKVWQFLKTLE